MIRLSRPGDEVALQDLFHVAFGDPPEATRSFFDALYRPGDAVLWAEGDTVASAMYLLDAGTIPQAGDTGDRGRAPLRVSYAYALATLPDYRGRGLGGLVTKAIIARSAALGFDCNLICPAEAGLFGYYAPLGYSHTLAIATGEVTDATSADFSIINNVMSTDFFTYLQLRAQYLPASAVAYPAPFLRYVEATCRASGGGLYRLKTQGSTGCAAVERRGDQLLVREVLPTALAEPFARALIAHLDAQSASFRTVPVPDSRSPLARCQPFVLAAFAKAQPGATLDAYFPFVLD